jgi:hypothetical protein
MDGSGVNEGTARSGCAVPIWDPAWLGSWERASERLWFFSGGMEWYGMRWDGEGRGEDEERSVFAVFCEGE